MTSTETGTAAALMVAIGGASDQLPLCGSVTLAGPERAVGPGRVLDTPAVIG